MRISDIKDAVTGDVVTATRAGGTLTGPFTVIDRPGRPTRAGEGYVCGVRVREASGSLREGVGVVSIERHLGPVPQGEAVTSEEVDSLVRNLSWGLEYHLHAALEARQGMRASGNDPVKVDDYIEALQRYTDEAYDLIRTHERNEHGVEGW